MSYNNSPVKNSQYIDKTITSNNYPNSGYQVNVDMYSNNLQALKGSQNQNNQMLDSYAKTGVASVVTAAPNVFIAPVGTSTGKVADIPDFDPSHNAILTLRNELDEKLRELYYTDNSILSDDKYKLDTTVYTGVLWTILATATVYFLFVDL